ncbi:MAG: error-prone DNA polymerase [Phycisphaerales bacterium]|nr:error-prone DNA polymerase [Phycisphaerales bacterium]
MGPISLKMVCGTCMDGGRDVSSKWAELQVTSNFSFLVGSSHPDELVDRSALLGHDAIALTDMHTVSGVVRGHIAAKRAGIPFVVGTRISLLDSVGPSFDGETIQGISPEASGCSILLYPTDVQSYGRMCRLLTLGKRRTVKGGCLLWTHDLIAFNEGLLAVILPPPVLGERFLELLEGLKRTFVDDRLSLGACVGWNGNDRQWMSQLRSLSSHAGIRLVAINDVVHHVPERKALQDVVTCIRYGCTLEQAGFRLRAHSERHLKSAEMMVSLYKRLLGVRDGMAAVSRTVEIAHRSLEFNLDSLKYEYPKEVVPYGQTPHGYLRYLVEQGAKHRYPKGVTGVVRDRLAHELSLIEELRYASYFLTVHDLVLFAKEHGILCQGRGAAANSAVCFCLGVTSVDPERIDMLFERFISRERDEPPDIDIDFEHERREEVIQYIYRKYGRERAALTGVVITYRWRSAVREVGKVLGFSEACIDRMAKSGDWWQSNNVPESRLAEAGVDPADPSVCRLITMAKSLIGSPRHLSQHVGGFVITDRPLCELVPIENAAMRDRTVIEWDKDDIDAMGMLKVDVLGLGMLTCIRKCFDSVKEYRGQSMSLATVPVEDKAVYDMICRADTVGVFQIESRAQMSMLPRLKPSCFYDLVIEVAIVRPGPIQGQMVHPYLRRRQGKEPVVYPSQAVQRVLEKTLGVPLFQEQAMSLAIVAAGFTPGEADQLRRAMASWKRRGNQMEAFAKRFHEGMLQSGYEKSFADSCFDQLKGFSEYGFPESHAASFALLVYVSAWLKCHEPAIFAVSLLNSQPMGFYAPAQIIRDAKSHGVQVLSVDILRSQWDCTLEVCDDGCEAIRLGMRLVKGLRRKDAEAVIEAIRANEAKDRFGIVGLARAAGLGGAQLRPLAKADAFNSMGLNRRQALWQVGGLGVGFSSVNNTIFADTSLREPAVVSLPECSAFDEVIDDYGSLGLSLKSHPISFIRDWLNERGCVDSRVVSEGAGQEKMADGSCVIVAGLVLLRQRPSTANGVVFITLEDEYGVVNLVLRPDVYESNRLAARHAVAGLVWGKIERRDGVVHVLVMQMKSLDGLLRDVGSRNNRMSLRRS